MPRYQTPVKGGRLHVGSAVVRELRKLIDAEARQYGCSRSWIITYHLAMAFGIKCEPYWKTGDRR